MRLESEVFWSVSSWSDLSAVRSIFARKLQICPPRVQNLSVVVHRDLWAYSVERCLTLRIVDEGPLYVQLDLILVLVTRQVLP